MTRKREMTDLDHRVCGEAARLRESLRLDIPTFARQLDVAERTVDRWEAHEYAPNRRQLLKLSHLRKIQEEIRADGVQGVSAQYIRPPAGTRRVNRKAYRQLFPALVLVLLESLGGRVEVSAKAIDNQRGRWPIMRYNSGTDRYEFIMPAKKETRTHAIV